MLGNEAAILDMQLTWLVILIPVVVGALRDTDGWYLYLPLKFEARLA
jgi:hypothetical protein